MSMFSVVDKIINSIDEEEGPTYELVDKWFEEEPTEALVYVAKQFGIDTYNVSREKLYTLFQEWIRSENS